MTFKSPLTKPSRPSTPPTTVAAAILAGGESRRFGYRTKALITIDGVTMLDHCVNRIRAQGVKQIAVCANNNAELKPSSYTLITEASCAQGGPLRGLYSAMLWANQYHPKSLLLTLPCDTPRLPLDLVQKLKDTLTLANADCVIAANHGKQHPTIGLWRTHLMRRLEQHLATTDNASLKHWLGQCQHCVLDFAAPPPDPFVNINSQSDLNSLAP